jgi:prepilin-type N-terminal cleavage/methylation domain-containing protein
MKSKGFTIIEMVVVMSIFLFIIGAAVSIFISIIQSQKKVLAEQQVLSQISYVGEYMAKSIRMAKVAEDDSCIATGYIYMLTRYDSSSGLFKGIKFINQSDSNACQEFFLDGAGTVLSPYILKELKNSTNDDDAMAITANNLKIDFVKFSVNGSSGSTFSSDSCTSSSQCGSSTADNVQPKVTLLFKIIISEDKQTVGASCTSDLNCSVDKACDLTKGKCVPAKLIQTTMSQRNINAE